MLEFKTIEEFGQYLKDINYGRLDTIPIKPTSFNNKNGYELELKFWNWILKQDSKDREIDIGLEHIKAEWLSQKSISEFDFFCMARSGNYYFDVVGHSRFRDSYRLNTGHKSWKLKLDWMKEYGCYRNDIEPIGYLAFTFDDGKRWRFYKMHNKLPKGDLLLTKERQKNILTAGWAFKLHGSNMKELKADALSLANGFAENDGITDKDKIKAMAIELEHDFIAENSI